MLIRCLEKSSGVAKRVWEKIWKVCMGKKSKGIEIWRRCVGLKAALAARRGQIGVE